MMATKSESGFGADTTRWTTFLVGIACSHGQDAKILVLCASKYNLRKALGEVVYFSPRLEVVAAQG
jgi:hypothetical protein